VLQARQEVGDEPFGLFLPDDIIDGPRPCLRQLIDVAEAKDAPVLALLKVSREELSRYGIVAVKPAGDRTYELTGMVEKPAPEKAPSDFAIMGRYVLTPDIFQLLASGKPGAGGEIQLTDGLLALAARRKVYGYEFEGTRYDMGERVGYVMTQIAFGLKRPDMADRLREYLKKIVKS
jgi:UTP--glucose-1-phosphate uridylyltransferase